MGWHDDADGGERHALGKAFRAEFHSSPQHELVNQVAQRTAPPVSPWPLPRRDNRPPAALALHVSERETFT